MLLAGIQAQHVALQDGAAVEEVRQRDIDGFSCVNVKKPRKHSCCLSQQPGGLWLGTVLTGADVQRPGERAVLGDPLIFAEAVVVRVIDGGSQGVGLQGEPVHLDAS